ncbi:hypothetical protein LWC34_13085 [Kibdelosporangium philippinense]|uniref:Uncharacterized protein n=1 Tax=Kibdelosporangium philippinense TaxID=211113 RepID=A0ABS8Z794_9PSEU|nr:hypothetical protein [Kibdelosporangium philippinense]MCE7003754.1 hypothetical protein [Kibdelosporangium philippinense]
MTPAAMSLMAIAVLAGHPEEPAGALGHDVEAWPVPVWPGLPETADRAVDQAFVAVLERLVGDG